MRFTDPELESVIPNIAGILPLAALIDFTDPEHVLHFYQLSGQGIVWNWVITPACARLILSHDGTSACCLDQGSAVPPLWCLDGRWGDQYHCSNPSTIRACMGVAALQRVGIDPPPRERSRNWLLRLSSLFLPPQLLSPQHFRPQRLRIILVSRTKSRGKKGLFGDSVRYGATVLVSGLVFLTVLVTTMLVRLYIATFVPFGGPGDRSFNSYRLRSPSQANHRTDAAVVPAACRSGR